MGELQVHLLGAERIVGFGWAGAHALPIPAGLPNDELFQKLLMFIVTGYVFKLVIALFDTIPFYFLTAFLKKYLEFDPMEEHSR